jgi:hypothetical protein
MVIQYDQATGRMYFEIDNRILTEVNVGSLKFDFYTYFGSAE